MRAKVTFGIALMVMITVAANGSAQGYWWGNTMGVTANPLGLTSEQLTQIQTINTEWQADIVPLWTQLQSKNLELQNLMWSPSPEPAEVTEKTKELNEIQAQIQQKSLEKQNAIRNVLTDEQKALYDQTGFGTGWGRGPCGLGLGRMNGMAGYGRGGGFGRRGGFGRGGGYGMGAGYGMMPGMSSVPGMGMGVPGLGMTPMGTVAPQGWGRGPCGMGFGRANWNRRRW
jgi:Spy/CpxP family protein refolding chaperone